MIKSTLVRRLLFVFLVGHSTEALAQRVEWTGIIDCVDRERVEAEQQRPALNPAVRVQIERTADGVTAHARRGSLERRIESANCSELQESLLLVLSLFPSEEDTGPDAPAEEPPETTSAEDVANRTTEETNAASSRAEEASASLSEEQRAVVGPTSSLWLGAALDFNFGSLITPSFAPSIALTFDRERLRVSMTATYRPPVDRAFAVGEVSLRGVQSGISIGGALWESAQHRARFLVAGGSDLMLVCAESRGVSQPAAGRVLMVSLNADAQLEWSPLRWFRLRALLGVAVPLVRPRYQIAGAGIDQTTPRIALRAGLFAEFRFWTRISR